MMIRIGDDWNQYILEALYFSLVFGDGGIKAFVCGSITGYVVGRMYIQLHATVGKNLGNGGDSHPHHCYETQGRQRTHLVKMVFQRNGSVYQRYAGVNYDVGNLKEVLTTGMAVCLRFHLPNRTR